MSVHPLDDERVDACIDAALDNPDIALELYRVESKDQANRAVWRLGRVLAELAEDERLYRDERERLEDWIEARRRRAERTRQVVEAVCDVFHRARLLDDPKAKTIHLPAGDLVARKAQDTWDIDDEEFLVTWAEQAGWDDIVRRRDPEVDRNALKRTFHVAPDGAVIAPDGEVVPGVRVVEGELGFKVRPKAVDQ